MQTTVEGKLISFVEDKFNDKETGDEIKFRFAVLSKGGKMYRFSVAEGQDLSDALEENVRLTLEFSSSADKASRCKVVDAVVV